MALEISGFFNTLPLIYGTSIEATTEPETTTRTTEPATTEPETTTSPLTPDFEPSELAEERVDMFVQVSNLASNRFRSLRVLIPF